MFKITREAPPRIEVKDNAAEPVQFAADELRQYMGRVLGVELSVKENSDAPVIRLLETPGTDLGEEGFLISMENGELQIRGGNPRAVLYGVYEFLRRYCGCLFSGLAPDGEYIPGRETIEVPPSPVRMTPRFWYRNLNVAGQRLNANTLESSLGRIDWMAKNGLNYVQFFALNDKANPDGRYVTFDPETGEERVDAANCCTDSWYWKHVVPHIRKRGLLMDMDCHNLLYFLPPELYFKKHPEWYMLREGKRVVGNQLTICTSNKDMLTELTKNFLNYIQTHPEVKKVGLGPMDGIGMCECDACRAMDESPDDVFAPVGHFKSPEGESRSKVRRYVRLINHVARAVKKEYPEIIVGYTAYADLFYTPRDISLDDNIIPTVDIYWHCAAHPIASNGCAVNRFFYRNLIKWRAYHKGKVFVWYPYLYGMASQNALPYPVSEMNCRDMQMFKEIGVDGLCGYSHELLFKQYNLNHLAYARCCWWNAVDHSKLTDEYLLGVFGKAGQALRPVYDSFHQSMLRIERERTAASRYLQFTHDPTNPGGCLLPNGFNIAYFMDELGEETLDRCVAEARSLAENDREQRQVEEFAAAAGYWKAAAAFFRAYYPTLDPLPDVTLKDLLNRCQEAKLKAEQVCEYIKSLNGRAMGWVPPTQWMAYEAKARRLDAQIEKLSGTQP